MSEIADHYLGPPCCHLIQVGDTSVLTDPRFSGRVLCRPGKPVAAGLGDLPASATCLVGDQPGRRPACFGDEAIPVMAAGPATSRAHGAGCTGARLLRLLKPGQVTAVQVRQPGQLLPLRTAAGDPFAGGRPGHGATAQNGA